jgi:uncharacterized repeat protein (TIGR01451 family)
MLSPNRSFGLIAQSRLASWSRNAGSLRALALFILIGVICTTLYLPSSATSIRKSQDSGLTNTGATSKSSADTHLAARASSLLSPGTLGMTPFMAMQSPEGVTLYASDCTAPADSFNLGDTVCAKASGVPASVFPWRILWVDPQGIVRESVNASPSEATEYTFTLPATPTSIVNGQTVDNRGTWRVNLVRSNGAVRQTAKFAVRQPLNPVTDLFVQKFNRSADGTAPAGGNVDFIIVVGNQGPDAAADVHLVDSTPSGGTLTSFTQTSGPACVPVEAGVDNDCVMATLAYGERAEFTAIYNVGSAAPGTYETSATVSSAVTVPPTTDPNTDNNTSTAQYTVGAAGSGATCEILCPSSINAVANTTEGGQRGAHVNYAEPVSSGDCGSISSLPASGSFFPVGTTTVTATSETGGGSCSFTITVVDEGSDPPTLSCPANPPAAVADGTCAASVSVGTATATGGSNVTLFATRSDGKPMYDCDVNGNCTRRSSDDPFAAGDTTITWFAYSHDVAGPYETAGDNEGETFEEQHRTGTAFCTQTVTVNDVTPPTITPPANQTVSADETCQFALPDYTSMAAVSDNCACSSSDTSEICEGREPITITQSPAAGTMVGLGPHTITLTANDGSSNNGGAGNTATAQFTVTVNDTTAPTVTAPADSSASADANCQAPVPDYVSGSTASDNCDSSLTLTQSPAAGTLVGPGSHTVTVSTADDAGNPGSDTVVFTVNDTTPPTISCPVDITVYLPPNSTATSTVVTYTTPSGADNCSGATTAQTAGLPSGASFPVGTTSNTFTVTDAAGLTASCSFNVTVLYNFTGFFSPINNLPTLNAVNAGKTIPIKFSLSGNKGLDIFAPNNPYSVSYNCATNDPGVDIVETENTGGSTLSYSPDTYHYNWKTETSWAGTCRQLRVTLNDGSVHVANFKFK